MRRRAQATHRARGGSSPACLESGGSTSTVPSGFLGSSPSRKNKKPGAEAGFWINTRKDARQLPGRMWDRRSARARRHAGGHAGAGQDEHVGGALDHPVEIESRFGRPNDYTEVLRNATTAISFAEIALATAPPRSCFCGRMPPNPGPRKARRMREGKVRRMAR